MSSLDMTLMRDTTSGATARLVCSTSRSTPSTRKRITSRFSYGSMWMSEAFSFTACVSSALIRRMMGASSSLSSKSEDSGNVLGQMGEVGVVVQAFEHLHRGAGARLVGNAQHRIEGFDRHAFQLQRHADEAPNFRQRLRRDAGTADRIRDVAGDTAHQHAVTLGERERQLARSGSLQFGVHGDTEAAAEQVAARPAAPRRRAARHSPAVRAGTPRRRSGRGPGTFAPMVRAS